jgi:hypothetical protein
MGVTVAVPVATAGRNCLEVRITLTRVVQRFQNPENLSLHRGSFSGDFGSSDLRPIRRVESTRLRQTYPGLWPGTSTGCALHVK